MLQVMVEPLHGTGHRYVGQRNLSRPLSSGECFLKTSFDKDERFRKLRCPAEARKTGPGSMKIRNAQQ